MFISSNNLSLTSVLKTSFTPVYFKTTFHVKLGVLYEWSGLMSYAGLQVSIKNWKISVNNDISFFKHDITDSPKLVFLTTIAFVLNISSTTGYDCFEI